LPTDRHESTLFHSSYRLPRALTRPSIGFSSLLYTPSPHHTPHHPLCTLTDPRVSTSHLVRRLRIQYVATGSAPHTPSPCLVSHALCVLTMPRTSSPSLMRSHRPSLALVCAPHGLVIPRTSTPPFARYFRPYTRPYPSPLLALATRLMHPVLYLCVLCFSCALHASLRHTHAVSAPHALSPPPHALSSPLTRRIRHSRSVCAFHASSLPFAPSLIHAHPPQSYPLMLLLAHLCRLFVKMNMHVYYMIIR
jgi:hypothetical protein